MMTLSMGLFSDKSFRKNIPGYRNENRTENVKAMAKTMAFIFCIRSHMRKLVNKIVDNLYLDRYSKQGPVEGFCNENIGSLYKGRVYAVFIKKFVVNFEETKSM